MKSNYMYPFLMTTQNMMKMDIWKNVPFISNKLTSFQRGSKTTLKDDKVRQSIIHDLNSKFHEENVNALKKLLSVNPNVE